MPKQPLWQRKSARQLVAQWTARRAPSGYCEDETQRKQLIISLCLGLIFAIAMRVPDKELAEELFALWERAWERCQ